MYKDGENYQSSVAGGIITLVFYIFLITVACVMVLNFFDREHYNLTQRYKCLTILEREGYDALTKTPLNCTASSKSEVITVEKFLELLWDSKHTLIVRNGFNDTIKSCRDIKVYLRYLEVGKTGFSTV